jgi:hypothetical protein
MMPEVEFAQVSSYKDAEFLRLWLARCNNRARLQREFPTHPTEPAKLSAKSVLAICYLTGCGFAQSELDELIAFLGAEGVLEFDGTCVSAPRRAESP